MPTQAAALNAVFTNECGAESELDFLITVNRYDATGFNTDHVQQEMLLFPDPCHGKLTFRLPYQEISHDVFTVSIYTLSGNQVLRMLLSSGEQDIDVSSLNPDLYIIQIDTGNRTYTGRFLRID